MIISIDEEKTFDKFQNTFMVKKKSLQNVSIEGTNHNIIKAMYEKPTAKLHSVMKVFPLR